MSPKPWKIHSKIRPRAAGTRQACWDWERMCFHFGFYLLGFYPLYPFAICLFLSWIKFSKRARTWSTLIDFGIIFLCFSLIFHPFFGIDFWMVFWWILAPFLNEFWMIFQWFLHPFFDTFFSCFLEGRSSDVPLFLISFIFGDMRSTQWKQWF